MIDASFSSNGRVAAISGAYQYDTGQRLRMYGLPSPDELSGRDDFLSRDTVVVQAQYSFTGDSQTESRIAEWDTENEVWTVGIPDIYLLRNSDVHLYVYVSYGQTEESMRSKTIYEAVFRPISRPAPSTSVTPDQTNAWDALVQEVTLAIANVKTAESNANAQAALANEAANAANAAAANAASDVNTYLLKLKDTQVALEVIGLSETPTVEVTDVTDADNKTYKKVTFRMPQSVVTVNNEAADENGNITLTPEIVGALPDTHQTVFEFTAVIPKNPAGTMQRVDIEGILETDRPVVDLDMDSISTDSLSDVLEAWASVTSVSAVGDGYIGVSNLLSAIDVPVPIKLLCVR